jgi:hypothetical protein
MKMEDTEKNIIDNRENKEKNIFLLITQLFILDGIVAFWNKLRQIFSIFKLYAVYGIFPIKKRLTLDEELQNSKLILEVFFVFLMLGVVFSVKGSNNLILEICSFLILIIYYGGIILFAFLGKIISFISSKNIKEIRAYIIREYNFLFFFFFVLMFMAIDTNNNAGSEGIMKFCLFATSHIFYSFFRNFFADKAFKRFALSLCICLIVFTVFLCLSTLMIGFLKDLPTQYSQPINSTLINK